MAQTPQLEDGFTRIANELYEAVLRFDFTQRQLKVVFAIIRKTYGYGKKEDDMSASQLSEMCGMARPHVTATISQLARMNVITKRQGHFGMFLGVQKSLDRWQLDKPAKHPEVAGLPAANDDPTCTDSVQCTELVHVPNQYPTCTDSVQVDSTESVHTKDNLSKETQKEKEKKSSAKKDALLVLNHLNEKAGKSFQPVKANLDFIQGRLAESGYDLCIAVIDERVSLWKHDKAMNEYLRPSTIFNATKFAQYVGGLKPVAVTGNAPSEAWRADPKYAGMK